MVFENLTLFEVSLDGARIGPRSIGRRDAEVDDVVEAAPAGGSRRFAPLVALVVVAGLAALYRRSRRSDVPVELEAADAELAEAA